MVKNGEAKEHLRYSIDSLYNYTLSVGDLHTSLDVGHGVKVLFLPCFFFFGGGGGGGGSIPCFRLKIFFHLFLCRWYRVCAYTLATRHIYTVMNC